MATQLGTAFRTGPRPHPELAPGFRGRPPCRHPQEATAAEISPLVLPGRPGLWSTQVRPAEQVQAPATGLEDGYPPLGLPPPSHPAVGGRRPEGSPSFLCCAFPRRQPLA